MLTQKIIEPRISRITRIRNCIFPIRAHPCNPWFNSLSFVFVLLCGSAVPTAFAQSRWTLVTADFQSRPVKLVSLDERQLTVVMADDSSPQLIKWDQVLELDPATDPPTVPGGDFLVYLNDGDCLAGQPTSIANDGVAWQNNLLGDLNLSEDGVNSIVRSGAIAPGLDQARQTDAVRLTNGDSTAGVLDGLQSGSVAIRPAGSDSDAQISLDKVAAILLASPAMQANSNDAVRVWLADGSDLTVPLNELTQSSDGKLVVPLGGKQTKSVDFSSIARLEQINGPVCWLTSLTPTQIDYRPYLEENFPPRFDHPVAEPRVTIRQKYPRFRHGIGVHSYTKLTFDVPDGFRAFRTQFAIDSIPGCDMTKADVTVRIIVDQKVVDQFPHVRFGGIAPPVVVDVTSAKSISLEVDYGDNLDAQDRFVWLDPAFLRNAPSTQP
jgi:NPCBM/NEW2 domain